jgi:hypothetical protein
MNVGLFWWVMNHLVLPLGTGAVIALLFIGRQRARGELRHLRRQIASDIREHRDPGYAGLHDEEQFDDGLTFAARVALGETGRRLLRPVDVDDDAAAPPRGFLTRIPR